MTHQSYTPWNPVDVVGMVDALLSSVQAWPMSLLTMAI